MDKETFFQEYKGVAIAVAAVVILGFIFLTNFILSTKQLALADQKGVSIKAGDSHTIKWSATNIKKVGIVLYNGNTPEWIVQDFAASAGKYVWNSSPSLASGGDYRIAVFEYPWRNGNKIAYAANTINIVGKQYVSCEDFGIQQEWPFLADNYAGAHKVFITSGSWSGKLGGVAGADEKCNQEAKKNNYEGSYVAFVGTDKVSAVDRITRGGIYM
ncbi:MAG: GPI anchored serine-threonine rich family protein, partial [Candidatus Pacebacteria bacterium]|nr:GPI anchored serine-threonine rich family protein [Candidatus Paceibacterota bacterium]